MTGQDHTRSQAISHWSLSTDAHVAERIGDLMRPPDGLAVVDGHAWDLAVDRLAGRMVLAGIEPRRIGGLVPALKLRLPTRPWDAPDYFTFGVYHFASQTLRDVLSPWASFIDWVPVDIVASDARGRQAHYQLMRLLACRPAFDLPASGLATGEDSSALMLAQHIALRDDLRTAPPLFLARDHLGVRMASDDVAERVVRAGCTGIEFIHPEDIWHLGRPRRIRGPEGVLVRGG